MFTIHELRIPFHRGTKMWMFSQVTLLMTSVPSHAMYLGMAYGWGANPHARLPCFDPKTGA